MGTIDQNAISQYSMGQLHAMTEEVESFAVAVVFPQGRSKPHALLKVHLISTGQTEACLWFSFEWKGLDGQPREVQRHDEFELNLDPLAYCRDSLDGFFLGDMLFMDDENLVAWIQIWAQAYAQVQSALAKMSQSHMVDQFEHLTT